MPLRNYRIAHKENEYFHPQKTFNKVFAGLLILMQCINTLYLYIILLHVRHEGDHTVSYYFIVVVKATGAGKEK